MKVQKKFFKDFPWVPVLGYAVLSLLVPLFLIPSAYAEQVLHYKTYHPSTGEEFNRFYYSIEKNLSGGYQVHWIIEEGGMMTD